MATIASGLPQAGCARSPDDKLGSITYASAPNSLAAPRPPTETAEAHVSDAKVMTKYLCIGPCAELASEVLRNASHTDT